MQKLVKSAISGLLKTTKMSTSFEICVTPFQNQNFMIDSGKKFMDP
jgi:hypothetical protein